MDTQHQSHWVSGIFQFKILRIDTKNNNFVRGITFSQKLLVTFVKTTYQLSILDIITIQKM